MASSSTPSPTPWSIKTTNQLTDQLAIMDANGQIVVTFPAAATTNTFINGILTKVFTASGAMQSTLNQANAEYIVRTVNQQSTVIDTLTKLQTAIDPSFNRVMPVSALRKSVFTEIAGTISNLKGSS